MWTMLGWVSCAASFASSMNIPTNSALSVRWGRMCLIATSLLEPLDAAHPGLPDLGHAADGDPLEQRVLAEALAALRVRRLLRVDGDPLGGGGAGRQDRGAGGRGRRRKGLHGRRRARTAAARARPTRGGSGGGGATGSRGHGHDRWRHDRRDRRWSRRGRARRRGAAGRVGRASSSSSAKSKSPTARPLRTPVPSAGGARRGVGRRRAAGQRRRGRGGRDAGLGLAQLQVGERPAEQRVDVAGGRSVRRGGGPGADAGATGAAGAAGRGLGSGVSMPERVFSRRRWTSSLPAGAGPGRAAAACRGRGGAAAAARSPGAGAGPPRPRRARRRRCPAR